MRWQYSGPVSHPPGFIEPCLPTHGHAVPSGPQWVYEIKHDGFRFIRKIQLKSLPFSDFSRTSPRLSIRRTWRS
jgi:ATP-dependent DNA ligase